MNRKIKFRAWDKACKTMIDDYAEIGGYGELYAKKFHPSSYSDKSVPNLILLQYTGLKDKNGKDIYEGDILSFAGNMTADDTFSFEPNGFIYDEDSIHQVVWNEKLALWELDFDEKDPPKYKRDTRYLMTAGHCKIIGNIHQNPELLEATNGTK